jgi:hypothetical protein
VAEKVRRGLPTRLEECERGDESSSYWTVYKKFASQSQHKYKIIIFFFGEAKDSVIFSFYFLLHKTYVQLSSRVYTRPDPSFPKVTSSTLI